MCTGCWVIQVSYNCLKILDHGRFKRHLSEVFTLTLLQTACLKGTGLELTKGQHFWQMPGNKMGMLMDGQMGFLQESCVSPAMLSFTTVCQSMASSADGAQICALRDVLYQKGWVM